MIARTNADELTSTKLQSPTSYR